MEHILKKLGGYIVSSKPFSSKKMHHGSHPFYRELIGRPTRPKSSPPRRWPPFTAAINWTASASPSAACTHPTPSHLNSPLTPQNRPLWPQDQQQKDRRPVRPPRGRLHPARGATFHTRPNAPGLRTIRDQGHPGIPRRRIQTSINGHPRHPLRHREHQGDSRASSQIHPPPLPAQGRCGKLPETPLRRL